MTLPNSHFVVRYYKLATVQDAGSRGRGNVGRSRAPGWRNLDCCRSSPGPLDASRRSLEPVVEPLESVPGALGQDSQGALVAVARGVQQFLIRLGVGAHGGVHIPLHGNAGRTVTALERV